MDIISVSNDPQIQPDGEEDREEEEEEALSLCDLPINSDENFGRPPFDNHHAQISSRRSSSDTTEFFEFFSDLSSEMSHAEDMIFCGKLVPFRDNHHHHHHNRHPCTAEEEAAAEAEADESKPKSSMGENYCLIRRRRCESLSELKTTTRSNSTKTKLLTRASRSLDYKKLYRNSSFRSPESPEMYYSRTSSSSGGQTQNPGKPEHFPGLKTSSSSSKPRWSVLMFGLVKFPPPEMDLQDMKSRQVRVRRNPGGTMFEENHTQKSHKISSSSSWGLLRVLSCKSHASVAVTSFGTRVSSN